jgi:hypothetical protein
VVTRFRPAAASPPRPLTRATGIRVTSPRLIGSPNTVPAVVVWTACRSTSITARSGVLDSVFTAASRISAGSIVFRLMNPVKANGQTGPGTE